MFRMKCFFFLPLFLLNIFYLCVDEARVSNQANSPTRSETVNEGSLRKKKGNCSAWVVGKVGQARYISMKQGRGEGG